MIIFLKFFLITLLSLPLLAAEMTVEKTTTSKIVLIAEKDSPVLARLLNKLKTVAPQYSYEISTQNTPVVINPSDYAVLVGANVPAHFDPKTHAKTFAIFVSESQAKRLQVQTSVWVEPPLSRQLTLANLIIPGDKKIGLLVNGEADKNKQLANLTNQQTLQLKVVDLADYENINQALYNVLKDTRLLLGSYNDDIYSAANIKNILITSYRQQKVLVGPSRAYLKAGSFATTFSDLNHIAKRLSDIVEQHASNEEWIRPGHNPYYRMMFNQQVARSLNLRVMSNDQLEKKMLEITMGEQ